AEEIRCETSDDRQRFAHPPLSSTYPANRARKLDVRPQAFSDFLDARRGLRFGGDILDRLQLAGYARSQAVRDQRESFVRIRAIPSSDPCSGRLLPRVCPVRSESTAACRMPRTR